MQTTLRWTPAMWLALVSGCGGHAATQGVDNAVGGASSQPVPCLTGPGVTTLMQDAGFNVTISGDQAYLVTINSILRIPIAGGPAVTIAQVSDPSGLLLLGGHAYFTAFHPDGPVDFQGKQPSASSLYSVPLAGGEPTMVLSTAPNTSGWTTDGTSIFYASYAFGITKLTPPSTTLDLPLDGKPMVDAIAVYGDYIYVATQDITSGVALTGAIQRIPKGGGAAQRIVANIGHPWSLLVDDTGLYWVEDPPTGTFGGSHIAHAALDGSGITTLLARGSRSMALDGTNLYFGLEDVEKMPKPSGEPTIIATGQTGEDLLQVAGGNLVWLDHVQKALSDPTPITLNTACINPR